MQRRQILSQLILAELERRDIKLRNFAKLCGLSAATVRHILLKQEIPDQPFPKLVKLSGYLTNPETGRPFDGPDELVEYCHLEEIVQRRQTLSQLILAELERRDMKLRSFAKLCGLSAATVRHIVLKQELPGQPLPKLVKLSGYLTNPETRRPFDGPDELAEYCDLIDEDLDLGEPPASGDDNAQEETISNGLEN